MIDVYKALELECEFNKFIYVLQDKYSKSSVEALINRSTKIYLNRLYGDCFEITVYMVNYLKSTKIMLELYTNGEYKLDIEQRDKDDDDNNYRCFTELLGEWLNFIEVDIIPSFKSYFSAQNIKEMYYDERDNGIGNEIKDEYHTMSELYFNRLVLFSVIVKQFKDKAFKSKKHEDGSMFKDFFIVGLETPQGQYSYHYHIKYWDMFDCKELEYAPKYDGHESSDIGRLYSLVG